MAKTVSMIAFRLAGGSLTRIVHGLEVRTLYQLLCSVISLHRIQQTENMAIIVPRLICRYYSDKSADCVRMGSDRLEVIEIK
jgi:hypothetical protein